MVFRQSLRIRLLRKSIGLTDGVLSGVWQAYFKGSRHLIFTKIFKLKLKGLFSRYRNIASEEQPVTKSQRPTQLQLRIICYIRFEMNVYFGEASNSIIG
jgi:hypothetical protein